MENILPLTECSIAQIYLDNQGKDIYKIPVYQRNYAWEEDEITALVKDVHDFFTTRKDTPYYIGTLVTYKRGDNEYEVIDGQQRLTTIYLLLKAMGVEEISNKLTYTARKISAQTIENLPQMGENVDWGITNGFSYAQKALRNIVGENELEAFKDYFFNKVHLIHYRVPKDVDLNHYFEVMNSRGEQLEKHEIVKSTLGQFLKNKEDLATFCRIWEACSEMNMYVQQVLGDTRIFGSTLSDFKITDFDGIPKQQISDGKISILSLLQMKAERLDDNVETVQNDRFQPIIDFPNFLLMVLKLTLLKHYQLAVNDFSLDDKELLNEFVKAIRQIKDKNEFARLFAFNLLQAKYLLDNYIVHHVMSAKEQYGENPWQLQSYYQESSNKKYPKNLSADLDTQRELVQLLSMFEVSFTARQRKNYLFYCLVHLFDNRKVDDYLEFARGLAAKYFYDVYLNESCLNERKQPVPNAFDKVIIDGNGVNVHLSEPNLDYAVIFAQIFAPGCSTIPLYVFNYTDYRLWKKYADELKGNKTKKESASRRIFFEELGCGDFDLEPFKNFYFSRTRKSLEHYYPQAKAVPDEWAAGDVLSVSQINCFGNFAMIGAEANSSGSNWDPRTKLDHYIDRKSDPVSVASLKFKIMLQRCADNHRAILNGSLSRPKDMEWNAEDICLHQQKMLDIVLQIGNGQCG